MLKNFQSKFRQLPNYWLKISIATFIVLGLTACGSTPSKQEANLDDPLASLSLETIPSFIEDARNKVGDQKNYNLLRASEYLLREGELDWARELMRSMDLTSLSTNHLADFLFLQGRLALALGEPYLAKRYLFSDEMEQSLNLVDAGLAATIRDQRATLLSNLSDFDAAVAERIKLNALLGDDPLQAQLNNDLLWESLMELPYADLKEKARTEKNEIRQGWYALATAAKNQDNNLQQQLNSIDRWLAVWPDHPASGNLPADLQLIRQLADEQPRQVAVLLPFSGSFSAAGEAIRDGFMAAFFNEKNNSGLVPTVRFYDTNNRQIDEIYDAAIFDGAEMVIGPLEKEAISGLMQRPGLPVPTLALNSVDRNDNTEIDATALKNTASKNSATIKNEESSEATSDQELLNLAPLSSGNLYSFSLAIESEARQVAEKAWRDGHRRALILAPASVWGDRGAQAFLEQWQALGGSVVEEQRYASQGNYSSQISQALDIDGSKQRNRALRNVLASNIEFEPRRRQDIDFVFLQAYGRHAQQIKPLLAFHYAADLQVYSTSHVFDGDIDSKNVRDLNKIKFTTLPWYFESELEEKRAINAYSKVKPGLQSLYALGVDAYHIYPRLKQFENFRQAKFYGATGRLSLSPSKDIERQQIWAEILNGEAIPLSQLEADDS